MHHRIIKGILGRNLAWVWAQIYFDEVLRDHLAVGGIRNSFQRSQSLVQEYILESKAQKIKDHRGKKFDPRIAWGIHGW